MALEMRRFLARLLPSLAKTYWSNRAEEVELTTANNDSRYDPPSVVSVENSVFKNGVTRGVSQHQHIEATGVKRMVSWTEKLKPGRSHKVQPTTFDDPNVEIADFYHPVNSLTRELAFGAGSGAKHRTKSHMKANSITFFTPNDRKAKIATVAIVIFFMAVFIFFWYEDMAMNEILAVKCNVSDCLSSKLRPRG